MKRCVAFFIIAAVVVSGTSCSNKEQDQNNNLEKEVVVESTEGKYAKEYTQKLKDGDYHLKYNIVSDQDGSYSVELIRNNNDYQLDTFMDSKRILTYIKDKEAFTVYPSIGVGIRNEIAQMNTEIIASELKLVYDCFKFEESKTENGYIIERFEYDIDTNDSDIIAENEGSSLYMDNHISREYYFDEKTREISKIIQVGSNSGKSEILFDSVCWESEKIEFNVDDNEYKIVSDYGKLDTEETFLISMLDYGITKDMIEGSKYDIQEFMILYYEDYEKFLELANDIKEGMEKLEKGE